MSALTVLQEGFALNQGSLMLRVLAIQDIIVNQMSSSEIPRSAKLEGCVHSDQRQQCHAIQGDMEARL